MWVYPEIRVLGDIVRYHARRTPRAIALISPDRRVTFAELEARSSEIAAQLIGEGLEPGSRIGYFGRNHLELAEFLFGTVLAGCVFMPLNWRLAPAEIAALIDDSECAMILVENDLRHLIESALGKTKARSRVRIFDPKASFEPVTPNGPTLLPSVETGSVALQMYTSGTTGLPKGVLLTHECFNYIRLCEHLDPAATWQPGETFLMFMPSFHMSGIGWLILALYHGMTVSMLAQFEPSSVIKAIRETRPQLTIIVPTALQTLLDHPDAEGTDFSCFNLVVYAGSPMPLPLIERALVTMQCGFLNCYGATELLSAPLWLRPEQHDLAIPERLQSVGTPMPLIEVRLLDPDGHEVGEGCVGELVFRMPSVFAGYWRKPDQTAAVLKNGWYYSGDAACRDAQGFYYLKDRIKDMIVSGGENIYSTEVEQALRRHPAVAEVAVIGVPDPRWGEAVRALVELKEGGAVEPATLIAFCREHIASYKVPKSILFVTGFPRTPSGKIQKAILRQDHAALAIAIG